MTAMFLLFDGNAIVHRAFHALPPLTVRRTGEVVNAVYGFASTLLKVLAELKPTHWAIAFDRPAPTFRKQMFEEYKAHRPETPEDLKPQIRRVHEVAETFQVPVFEMDGFEADDILATLSTQATQQGIETIIVTGDADILQLVSPAVRVFYPRRSFSDTVLYDEAGVRERYGLNPIQIPDLKALVGDTSDNIPGVKGIGEKTAAKLLTQFASIEDIYAHLDRVQPEKLRGLLAASRDQAFQSRELATVVRNVPVSLDLETCRVSAYDRQKVVTLFRDLEFVGLLGRLPQEIGSAAEAPVIQRLSAEAYRLVNSEPALADLAARLAGVSEFAIDIQTSTRASMTADLVGIAVAVRPGEAWYIPLTHQGLEQPAQLPLEKVRTVLGPCFFSTSVAKSSHNGKHAIIVLKRYGIELHNLSFDTMVAAHLVGEKSLSLEPLAFNRLGTEISPIAELTGTGARQQSPAVFPAGQVLKYACSGADVVLRLKNALQLELDRQELVSLFREVEIPLIPILAAMEMNGVSLDLNLLRQLSAGMGGDILKLEAAIYNAVGHQFNINSPQQLGNVLYEDLKLPPPRKVRGAWSTEASVLEELRTAHPAIGPILEYRTLTKLKSTYLDALPLMVNPGTGRVHTSFNQTVTVTGRLSSSDPNLQNIPVRGDLGRQVRRAIVAAPGYSLLAADYSQIDLRVLAHLSRDPSLVDAFLHNQDIHTATAALVFNVPAPQVTPEMRRVAKTVNFGVIYGMSDYGLEQATEFSREESAEFIARYFQRYPGVKEYLDRTRVTARQLGYVQTLLGRRRYIPEIHSPNRIIRESAERMAINMPVQGTSADIIKVATVRLAPAMQAAGLTARLLLQVHDELVFEVPPSEETPLKEMVNAIMPHAIELIVPVRIDIKQGRNWGEME